MASKIQIRRDTASNWTSANPTLSNGELGLETDTKKLKSGDGATAWTSLAYYTLGTAGYAAYADTTANFTGTLQEGGSNVVTAGDLGTNVATFLGTPSSANLASAVTDETGSGALAFATSPTFVTPALGTPASGVATNLTGTAASLTAGTVTTNANLTGHITSTGNATVLGSFTSAQLATALTNETGSGAAVFGTAPTLTGVTLAGAVTGADQIVSAVNLKDYGEVTNAIGGTGGGTQDIDLTLGNSVSATVDTSANTFTFSNPTASDELCGFTLTLTNGGSQTVNWPGTVDWAAATAPTLTAVGVDILCFYTIDGGTRWYGFLAGAAMA